MPEPDISNFEIHPSTIAESNTHFLRPGHSTLNDSFSPKDLFQWSFSLLTLGIDVRGTHNLN